GTDSCTGARTGASLLRQALADLYACRGSENIRLLTDSENLTEEHSQALRRRFHTAPIPVDTALSGPRRSRLADTSTIVYLGDARTEKGYARLPSVAYELKEDLAAGQVRMIIQSNF